MHYTKNKSVLYDPLELVTQHNETSQPASCYIKNESYQQGQLQMLKW